MKNEKLLRAYFRQDSSRTPVVIALITGLAVGASLAVLFAPNSGNRLRDRLCGLIGLSNDDTDDQQEVQYRHTNRLGDKRPKSDIKSLIQQSHLADAHTEQSLS